MDKVLNAIKFGLNEATGPLAKQGAGLQSAFNYYNQPPQDIGMLGRLGQARQAYSQGEKGFARGVRSFEEENPNVAKGVQLASLAAGGAGLGRLGYKLTKPLAKKGIEALERQVLKAKGYAADTPYYHGSSVKGIKEFVTSKMGAVGAGVYLTPEMQTAQKYMPATGELYKTYIKNPKLLDVEKNIPTREATDIVNKLGLTPEKTRQFTGLFGKGNDVSPEVINDAVRQRSQDILYDAIEKTGATSPSKLGFSPLQRAEEEYQNILKSSGYTGIKYPLQDVARDIYGQAITQFSPENVKIIRDTPFKKAASYGLGGLGSLAAASPFLSRLSGYTNRNNER